MTDVMIVLVVLAVCGAAARYIYKAKKRGVKCIGCPFAGAGGCGSCASSCGETGVGCSCQSER